MSTIAPHRTTDLLSTTFSAVSVLRQLPLIIQWQFLRMSGHIALLVIIQILLSVTTVLGYGLLVGIPSPEQALYLATGASTVTLIMVGLVMTPQMVTTSRTEGSLDWIRTLPVPRTIFLIADLTIWTFIALPGTALGVIAGAWKFDIDLSLSPWLPLAAIAVSLTSSCVGYAIACLCSPQIAQLMSQVLIFVLLFFSPVSYPASRLPTWLAEVHQWLPIEPMADAMRASLVSDVFTVSTRSVVVLSVWLVASITGVSWALSRRI